MEIGAGFGVQTTDQHEGAPPKRHLKHRVFFERCASSSRINGRALFMTY